MTATSVQEIAAILEQAPRVLLVTHMRPDGDAVGSLTGLGRSLIDHGREVHLVMRDPPGERFRYMAEGLLVERPADLSPPYDLVVILDCGDLERTGFAADLQGLATPLLNIDHHLSNPRFGRWNLVNAEASSTCEMLVELIRTAGWPLGPDVARSLYSGICTDTRFFQIDGVCASTLRAAALLLETGVQHAEIMGRLSARKSLQDLRVLARGLERARVEMEGRLIWTRLALTDLEELGAVSRNAWSAGLFSKLISLDGALAAVTFVESEEGGIFSEFRSRREVDVQAVATRFGGGGHRQASGCRLPDAEQEVLVLEALREAVSRAFGRNA